jgi:hypothetical protein
MTIAYVTNCVSDFIKYLCQSVSVMVLNVNFNNISAILWRSVLLVEETRTQFMLPMEKSVTFTGACANDIISSINRSFVYKAKEGGYCCYLLGGSFVLPI